MSNQSAAQRLADRVAAKAKKIAGSVMSDDALRREGELHQKRARAAAEADRQEASAERDAAATRIEERDRELALEEQQLRDSEKVDAVETVHEQAIAQQDTKIESDRERAEREAQARELARESALDRNEATAAAERAQGMREADAAEDGAERAERRAEAYDDPADRR